MDPTDAIPEALLEAARELPDIYRDPAHYDVLAQMTAPEDLPFYRALLAEHGGPVLELGCGTGRITLELAREGVEVVGVELSAEMLELAHRKAQHEQIGVTLALGDIRSFRLDRPFRLVLLPYNTLNHMLDPGSLARCLRTVRRHMDAESRFVIDTFQPSLAFLASEPHERRPILRFVDPYLDKEVRLFEENHYEPATQRNRIVWSYEVDGTADARVEELTMRLYFPGELDACLHLAGFEIEAKYGDYERAPFGSTSSKQLVVCRLRDPE